MLRVRPSGYAIHLHSYVHLRDVNATHGRDHVQVLITDSDQRISVQEEGTSGIKLA